MDPELLLSLQPKALSWDCQNYRSAAGCRSTAPGQTNFCPRGGWKVSPTTRTSTPTWASRSDSDLACALGGEWPSTACWSWWPSCCSGSRSSGQPTIKILTQSRTWSTSRTSRSSWSLKWSNPRLSFAQLTFWSLRSNRFYKCFKLIT